MSETLARLSTRPLLFLSLLSGFLFGPHSLAQEIRGTITGTVTDAQGAAISGAQVEVKSLDTNVAYPTTTNDSGFYSVPLLQPGNYSVTVTRQGFARTEQPRVQLTASQIAQTDFHLQIGSVTQQMEVTAQAPLLEAASATREQTVSEQAVANTPLEGRNSFLLSTLTAGVYFGYTDNANAIRPFDNGGMDSMEINGGLPFRNNFTLNGLSDTNSEGNGTPSQLTYAPPPDAVKEVTVESNSYDSQFGHTGGGNINVDLKSGTNQFHGSAYDYVRNTIFNANRWENNAQSQPRTPYHWSEPGVEFDGPLYLPKLYDGRNKTFFMFSWERIQDSIPQPLTASVPTVAERTGDFSQSGQTIFDPCNTTLTYNAACTNNGSRTTFPNNVIPTSRLNPVGLALLNTYPLPNSPSTNGLNNYFYGSSVSADVYDAFTYTVDQNINDKNRVSASYFQSGRHQIEPTYGYANTAAAPEYLHYRVNHGGSANWTSTLNPTTVLDVRFGFERHNFAVNPYSIGYDLTKLGFPASFVSELGATAFPTIGVTQTNGGSGLQGLGTGFSVQTKTNTYSLQGTMTKILGKHTVKIGGQFNVVLNNEGSPIPPSFNFDSTFTQQNPLINNATQGNGFADLALGYATSGNATVPGQFAYGNHYYAAFIQDDWRVNSRLTLNVGFRWDLETPLTERYNRLNAGFAFSELSPLQVPGLNPLSGGLLFVNSNNRSGFLTDYNNIQPRVGAAYRLGNNTVIRGGFGIYYLPTFDIPGTAGYSTSSSYVASINGNVTPANIISNPFPTGISQPTGSSLGLATLLGQGISFGDPGRVIPNNWQYSFGLQHQLPGNFLVEATYAGSRTHNIEASVNIDSNSAQQVNQLGSTLNNTVTNPFAGLLPGTSLNGPTTTLGQLLLPYPQYSSVTENYIPIGRTWFNSLQVRIEKRFSNSLYFLVSYTFSKNMYATSWLNPQDALGTNINGSSTGQLGPDYRNTLMRQLAPTDVPQQLRISGGYELPFFRHSNKWLKGALGGWQINSVVNYSSGIPVAAPSGAFSTGVDPNIVPSASGLNFNNCYINLSGQAVEYVGGSLQQGCISGLKPAWIQQPAFTLNTLTSRLPSTRLSRPPLADVSLFKSFPIHERLVFQLRGEAFNVTNTPWFPGPTTSLTSPFFGRTVLGTGGFGATSNDPRAIQLSARIQF